MYPIEAYRDAFPNLPEARLHRLMAVDGFIRRAAQLPHPFTLKGSALTRQYPLDACPPIWISCCCRIRNFRKWQRKN